MRDHTVSTARSTPWRSLSFSAANVGPKSAYVDFRISNACSATVDFAARIGGQAGAPGATSVPVCCDRMLLELSVDKSLNALEPIQFAHRHGHLWYPDHGQSPRPKRRSAKSGPRGPKRTGKNDCRQRRKIYLTPARQVQPWRIKGSIVYRMRARSLSTNQLAALSALIATPALEHFRALVPSE
jgi:hypothetical protein